MSVAMQIVAWVVGVPLIIVLFTRGWTPPGQKPE
jgi:hypothetical protein